MGGDTVSVSIKHIKLLKFLDRLVNHVVCACPTLLPYLCGILIALNLHKPCKWHDGEEGGGVLIYTINYGIDEHVKKIDKKYFCSTVT